MILNIRDSSNPALMYMSMHDSKIRKDIERLSSGYRINRASDDAAGLAISEAMRNRINGLTQGHRNELEGIGYIQVGDGALSEIHDILRRMKTLSTQAANGTMDDNHRSMIDSEMQELKQEITRIGDETMYGGVHVFNNKIPAMFIEDNIYDGVTIYNNTNDHYTDNTSDDTQDFGGILIPSKEATDKDGNPSMAKRIRWDEINRTFLDGQGKLGYRDTTTGEWHFNPGEYDWTDSDTKVTYHFKVLPGAKVPEISRMHEITADDQGISIDGNIVKWDEVKNADGVSVKSLGNVLAKGNYSFYYKGATITIYVPEQVSTGIAGLADLVNSTQKFAQTAEDDKAYISSTLMTDYSGTVNEKAADTEINEKDFNTTTTLANMIYKKDLNLSFKADKSGLSLLNTRHDGTFEILDTKSWDDLKIVKSSTSDGVTKDGWDWGNNASASQHSANVSTDQTFSFEYTWTPNDSNNYKDTTWKITLPMAISNIARDEAVYFAFNDMNIQLSELRTDYSYNMGYTDTSGSSENIVYTAKDGPDEVTFKDEYENSGRYLKKDNTYKSGLMDMKLDENTWDVSFDVPKLNAGTGDVWYTMTANARNAMQGSEQYIRNSLSYATGLARTNYINGDTDTDYSTINTKVQVDPDKNTISFSSFNNLNELNAKGFSISNQETSGRYNLHGNGTTVLFTTKQADENNYSTLDGLRYKRMHVPTGDLLMIDLDSLSAQNVTIDGNGNTKSVADVIEEISKATGFYNDKNTRFLRADGANLIISDVNKINIGDTPYAAPTHGAYELVFKSTDGTDKEWGMYYAYNYADFSRQIKIKVSDEAVSADTVDAFNNNLSSSDTVLYVKNLDANRKDTGTYNRLSDEKKQKIGSKIIADTDKQVENYMSDFLQDQTVDGNVTLTDQQIAEKRTQKQKEYLNDNIASHHLYTINVKYLDIDNNNKELSEDEVVTKTEQSVMKSLVNYTKPNVLSEANSTIFDYSANENIPGNIAVRAQQHSRIQIEEGHSDIKIQHSNRVGDYTKIPRFPMNAEFLNLGSTNTRTLEDANRAMTRIENAVDHVSRRRAQFGSVQNSLEHAMRSNQITTENLTAAESRIRDTDMANGIATLMKDQILSQAAQSMLAQANQHRYSMISLLQ